MAIARKAPISIRFFDIPHGHMEVNATTTATIEKKGLKQDCALRFVFSFSEITNP
jgi:hypothetical protein